VLASLLKKLPSFCSFQVDLGSAHTLPAIGLALIEALPKLFPGHAKRQVQLGAELKARVQKMLGEDGVLILPTYPTTAPAHGMALLPPTNWVPSRSLPPRALCLLTIWYPYGWTR